MGLRLLILQWNWADTSHTGTPILPNTDYTWTFPISFTRNTLCMGSMSTTLLNETYFYIPGIWGRDLASCDYIVVTNHPNATGRSCNYNIWVLGY
jgi:hypothetical protein